MTTQRSTHDELFLCVDLMIIPSSNEVALDLKWINHLQTVYMQACVQTNTSVKMCIFVFTSVRMLVFVNSSVKMFYFVLPQEEY